jgi:hypothetical protein
MEDIDDILDIDDIKRKLREMGVPFNGEWGATKELHNIESPVVKKQKKALLRMEALLQSQVDQDQKRVAELHVQLQRLKNGGGS